MKVSDYVTCVHFPCQDVNHTNCIVPSIDIDPDSISIILISEAAPENLADYYYADGQPLFMQTTVQAFRDAGASVSSIQDILDLGVYMTTAVKCSKTSYGIKSTTIKECSFLLEEEINKFPGQKVYLLMGDVAIKAINYIAKRNGEKRVIPAGSTYKIRTGNYLFRGTAVFPSYTQAGPAFFIEKSKRKMIAEDIANALKIIA